MAVYDLRKASKVSSGQKVISMGTDNSNLEKRVANIENKLNNGALMPHITSLKWLRYGLC